jgi:hypothetical protein
MDRRVLTCKVNLVGLHELNGKNDVEFGRGYIKLDKGTRLSFNRDARLFGKDDSLAVNVIVESGQWKGEHVGHIATIWTEGSRHLMWGHILSALMDGDDNRLPDYLQGCRVDEILTFQGECAQPSTHAAKGSWIYVHIHTTSTDDVIIEKVATYLRTARMEVAVSKS